MRKAPHNFWDAVIQQLRPMAQDPRMGYLGGSALAPDQIATYAAAAGFQGDDLTTAVAVALGESGGVVDAHNNLGNREDSWGLWQINRMAHPEFTVDFLITPAGNASAAFSIWQNAGSWQPWGSFTNGSYAKFLPAAQQATQSYVADQQPSGLNTIMSDGTVVDPQGNVVSTVAGGSPSPGPAMGIVIAAGVFLAVDYLFLRE